MPESNHETQVALGLLRHAAAQETGGDGSVGM